MKARSSSMCEKQDSLLSPAQRQEDAAGSGARAGWVDRGVDALPINRSERLTMLLLLLRLGAD